MNIRTIQASLLLCVFILCACKKVEPDTETQSAVDNNIAETEFTAMHGVLNNIAENEIAVRALTSICYTIISPDTISSPGWPRTMTVDYGAGCTDSLDGKTRKGKVHLSFSNRWHLVGSVMKITFENYQVNNLNMYCDSIRIVRTGAETFSNRVFNGRVTSGSWQILWNADRQVKRTEGAGDFDRYNDVFRFTGSASGKNRAGLSFSANITNELVMRGNCRWISSGRLDLSPEGLAVRTVDFGDGSCNSEAILVIDGNTFTFTMN